MGHRIYWYKVKGLTPVTKSRIARTCFSRPSHVVTATV